MDSSLFVYLERLELMTFFSGYAFIFLFVRWLADSTGANRLIKTDIRNLLPYGYALVGVLYLALQLKTLYPDYSIAHIRSAIELPVLKIWGLLAILFFVPLLAKKPIYSVLHSLVFFFFLVQDLWLSLVQEKDSIVLRNDMNVYSISLLINLVSFILVVVLFSLYRKLKKTRN